MQSRLTILVSSDCTWSLTIDSKEFKVSNCYVLATFLPKLDSVDAIKCLLSCLDNSKICIGNPDDKFKITRDQHQGIFKDRTGKYSYIICII